MKKTLFFIRKNSSKVTANFLSLSKNLQNKLKKEKEVDVNEQLVIGLNSKKIPGINQIKQLPKFLNKAEKLGLGIALILLFVSVFGLGWRFYIKNSTEVQAYGGSYTEGLIGSKNLINPILAINDVDRDLVNLMFSGLMKYDEQGELVPDLASGYTIDAEQKIYTFELRENIKWHDEEPLTSDDVLFTINSIKNSEYKSPFKNSFSGVQVRKINDRTIQFELEKPFAPFLSILTIGIIPEHLWYSIPAFGANLAELNTKPIGSGPYKFAGLTRDGNGIIKSYNLEAFEDYHLGKAYISELNFKFYPDFDTGIQALQNKNIDGLINLPIEYKNLLENKVAFHNLQFPQYTALFFNPTKNALLNNADIRRALAISIDKQKILDEVLNDNGQLIDSPLLPGMLGYNQDIKAEVFDIETAKQILNDQKWIMPKNGLYRIKDDGEDTSASSAQDDEEAPAPEELVIKLTTIDQTENVKIVSILKENWEAIGIKTELEIVAKDKIRKDIIEPRDYQILVFGEVINTNAGPYPFWHSSQNKHPGLNLSVMANKDIDKYLEIANTETDQEKKVQALEDFQKKLLELNFAIFLYNPTYIYPTSQSLKGLDNLRFINLPADRFNNINSWYIKTKRILSNK